MADLEVSTASGGEFLVTRSGNSGVTLQQVNGGDATSGSLSIKAGTAMSFYTTVLIEVYLLIIRRTQESASELLLFVP